MHNILQSERRLVCDELERGRCTEMKDIDENEAGSEEGRQMTAPQASNAPPTNICTWFFAPLVDSFDVAV